MGPARRQCVREQQELLAVLRATRGQVCAGPQACLVEAKLPNPNATLR